MAEKVYEPEVVQENPFPGQNPEVVATVTEGGSGGTFAPAKAKERSLPRKRVAVELLSQALNTRSRKILQEFDLQQSGGFQIGNFQEGVSGDVRITPNGITARDTAGITTFALDGSDGSAVFKGSIQSGSLITGEVVVGNNRVLITLDENGEPQIIVNDGTYDRVLIGYGDF